MKKTPNIGLTEIGTSYTDKDIKLMEWRTLIAGEDSSNMSIIDKEVGDLKKVIKKDGTGQKYLSDDGTYRYVSGGGGTSKLAFASDDYLVYTATSNTTTFTIADMSTSKSVELIKDNLVMMQGLDYDIDKSTGVVTLSHALNNGEKIYYNVVEGEEKAILYSNDGEIEANREKCLTDINGNFIAPKTTIAAVDGLSENILALGKQINVLSGYTSTSTDTNDLTNGKWYLNSQHNPTNDIYYVEHYDNPISGYAYQVARNPFVNVKYERRKVNSVWQPWQQIDTTYTFDDINPTLYNNWVLRGNAWCPRFTVSGKTVHLSMQIQPKENTIITSGIIPYIIPDNIPKPRGASFEKTILSMGGVRLSYDIITNGQIRLWALSQSDLSNVGIIQIDITYGTE